MRIKKNRIKAAAISALLLVAGVTVLKGLIPTIPQWLFALSYIYMVAVLAVVVLGEARRPRWNRLPFLLNHAGLLIVIVAAWLGSIGMQRLRVIARMGMEQRQGSDEHGRLVELPLIIELQEFLIEEYPAGWSGGEDMGMPRSYASVVSVTNEDSGHILTDTITVNHPLEMDGWSIYQWSHGWVEDGRSDVSVVQLVSDPWLPLVNAGIAMMAVGAVCMFACAGRRKPEQEEGEGDRARCAAAERADTECTDAERIEIERSRENKIDEREDMKKEDKE